MSSPRNRRGRALRLLRGKTELVTIKANMTTMGTQIRRIGNGFVIAVLIGAACAAVATPAAAEVVGHSASARTTREFAAQSSRPRVTIYPRHQQLSANSVRQCRAQYVKEYRPSGTVIVPRVQCWWE
jgi:hypothetical protein